MVDNYIDLPVESGGSSGVASLNGLTGALTLVAGAGITITPAGSNITIANQIVRPYYSLWNKSLTESFPSGLNQIIWDTAEYDPDNLLTSGVDFTIPSTYVGDAICQVTVGFRIKIGSGQFDSAWILYKNGSPFKYYTQGLQTSAGTAFGSISGSIDFTGLASDVFSLYIETSAGIDQLDSSPYCWVSYKIMAKQV